MPCHSFIPKFTLIDTLYNNVLLSLHQQNPVDFGFSPRLCHNHSERYRPRLDNFLPLELPIAAFNSLTNQRQQFPENHRVPITPNHQGTWEMQDKVRASVGDHDVSSDFVPCDLDDIQFYWENPNIEMDAVNRQSPSLRHCLKTFL